MFSSWHTVAGTSPCLYPPQFENSNDLKMEQIHQCLYSNGLWLSEAKCCSVAESCLTLCSSMDCRTPSFPVLHNLLAFAQTHVHWVSDIIQTSHSLLPLSHPGLSLSQHQGLFQWTGSSHLLGKVLELRGYKYWRLSGYKANLRLEILGISWQCLIQKLDLWHGQVRILLNQNLPICYNISYLSLLCQFSSVQPLNRVWLFATPWTGAHQASLSITNSRSYSNSCPPSWWCHPTVSSFVVPFSFCLQSFPASGSFQMSQFFASGG